MVVTLLNKPEIEMSDWAIGECYDKGCYTDPEKRMKRLVNVANVKKHSSILEFTDAIFEITACTKVLLEMTRHRHANYACKSTRYTLNKGELVFDSTGNELADRIMEHLRKDILCLIEMGVENDVTSLMLPAVYEYRWVAKFNYRSLQNFLALRTDKHAHFKIREVAFAMYESLPQEHKVLFNDNVKKG